MQPLRRPRRLLRADGGQHPVAERVDQPGLLGHRDEVGGRDHAVHRVLPAQQRLERRPASPSAGRRSAGSAAAARRRRAPAAAAPRPSPRPAPRGPCRSPTCRPRRRPRTAARAATSRAGRRRPRARRARRRRARRARCRARGSGTATSTQSEPTSSPSERPTSAHALRLASSTRPSASSARSGASAASIQRRTPSAGGRVALEVLRELAADGGEHRRHLGVGLGDALRVELDHAGAAVGDRDREGGRGHQPGATGHRRARLAPAGARRRSPTTGAGTPTRARAAPGRPPAPRGSWPRTARRSSGPALARCQVAAQRSPLPSSDGRQTAPQLQSSVSPSVASTRGDQLARLEPGRDVVGDRLLGEQEAVRAADPAAQARRVERAGERARQLRRVGDERRRRCRARGRPS